MYFHSPISLPGLQWDNFAFTSPPLPLPRTNDRASTVAIVINPFELTFEALRFPKWFIYHRDFDEVFTGPSRLVAVVMGSQLTAQ